MTTQVKVTKVGENLVLPLSAEMLREIGVVEGENIDISIVDGKGVFQRTEIKDDEREFRAIAKSVFDDYDEVFTALAEGAK